MSLLCERLLQDCPQLQANIASVLAPNQDIAAHEALVEAVA